MPDYGHAAQPSTQLAVAASSHPKPLFPINKPQSRKRTLQGRMAKTRAGKPEPPLGFGKLMTTIAPNSST